MTQSRRLDFRAVNSNISDFCECHSLSVRPLRRLDNCWSIDMWHPWEHTSTQAPARARVHRSRWTSVRPHIASSDTDTRTPFFAERQEHSSRCSHLPHWTVTVQKINADVADSLLVPATNVTFSVLQCDIICFFIGRNVRTLLSYILSPFFPTFRNNLHIFVDQSSSSSSSRSYCLFSEMSAVSLYLVISSRLLSVHLSLGRPLLLFPGSHRSPVQPCPSFFLRGFLLTLFWCVHTNLIFSVSGMLTFGILWHLPLFLYDLVSDMVLFGLTHYPS